MSRTILDENIARIQFNLLPIIKLQRSRMNQAARRLPQAGNRKYSGHPSGCKLCRVDSSADAVSSAAFGVIADSGIVCPIFSRFVAR